ncbi:deoxynucleoside kinase [candidate division KSB1 bacterium]|nr:deoxynucleoside kinase [bacterium]RKY79815.1 MAG: deoxynucleoside kinase [candidate division KSB1 bacterium]HDI51670.1 deoxynucleoside kinase [Bacteroidota bacterium]RKY80495.1 MAG: deoxynucleoside kinase [candidate division KSB1 bacterium]RKY88838.1 MAG: deoxynucleoside kinase [candidate division KSB1 bacterium]
MPKSLHYIAIEGVIGVGKTSLATLLSKRLRAKLVLEKHEDNPFLADFYQSPQRYAFQTQMFFLLNRYRQQLDLWQRDLFHPMVITDYLFARDRIFASLTLEEREFLLYEKLASLLEREVPRPDLVVYLQANTSQLMANIKKRGRVYEKNIAESYIRSLVEAYNNFFFHYKETSLLVVDTTQIDFVNHQHDLDNLIEQITMPLGGIKFYIPRLK